MAARTAPLSLQEFHTLYDGLKPAFEYWHGAAIQKSEPTVLHGVVQVVLATLLEEAGWNAASEVRLKVVPDLEPVPDLIAVRGKFLGRYPAVAPALCIEILSPRDTLAKTLKKARTYLEWGSQCAWIIDPEKRTAWYQSQGAAAATWVAPDESLWIEETSIPLPVLFAEVDRKLELIEE